MVNKHFFIAPIIQKTLNNMSIETEIQRAIAEGCNIEITKVSQVDF